MRTEMGVGGRGVLMVIRGKENGQPVTSLFVSLVICACT